MLQATNYLNGKVAYLCGPIHAVADDGVGWRDAITPRLKNFGIIVDDPCKKTVNGMGEVKDDKKMLIELMKTGDFGQVKKKFYPIVRKDLRAVDKADFLIVVYDPTIHIFGTIHEMIIASQQRKPILLFFDKAKIDKFNPWCLTLVKENMIFTEWDDMFAYLNKIDLGEFDTSYWTL
jgi:nucleoside 2-deoxyribosyltransferase